MFISPVFFYLFFLCFRFFLSFFLISSFNPDDPWQSLEVSYSTVFPAPERRHGLTWEWKPEVALRSVVHPGLFMLFYHVLSFLSWDSRFFVFFGPRFFQSFLIAFSDLRFSAWLARDFPHLARPALFVYFSCWFVNFTLVRLYSNSLEAALSLIAFSYWPWQGSETVDSRRLFLSFLFSGFSVVIRPTSFSLWIFLVAAEIFRLCRRHAGSARRSAIFSFVSLGFAVVFPLLIFQFFLDFCFYGIFQFPPWNFLKANMSMGVSRIYGESGTLWLINDALPSIFLLFSPVLIFSVWRTFRSPGRLANFPFWAAAVYSIINSGAPHKEIRFLLPVLPLFCIEIARTLMILWEEQVKFRMALKVFALLALLSNLAALIFFGRFYQSAPYHIVNSIISLAPPDGRVSVFFLTDCHDFPHYSAFHTPSPSWQLEFLACAPAFRDGGAFVDPLSPQEQFRRAPNLFLTRAFSEKIRTFGNFQLSDKTENFPSLVGQEEKDETIKQEHSSSNRYLPDFLVIYKSREPELSDFLRFHGFLEVSEFFHSFEKTREKMKLFKRKKTLQE